MKNNQQCENLGVFSGDTEQDNGRQALNSLKKGSEERKKIMTERAHEEAVKKLPPVVPLGFLADEKTAMYYIRPRRAVVRLKPSEHKADYFMTMASLDVWGGWLFPDMNTAWLEEHENQVWKAVKRKMMDTARESGRYDPARLRKIGMWAEEVNGEKGILYNAGDACYFVPQAGGILREVDCVQGRHIYASDLPMPKPSSTPMPFADGEILLGFLRARQWQFVEAGELIAGWIVCALLAGALSFRPHVWLTAPAKTGKTHLYNDIARVQGWVKDCREGVGLLMEGATTSSAGARQKIDSTARPVMFDEAEGDGNSRSESTILEVLKMMRTAATSATGIFSKGGEDGTPKNYMVKNCFLLCSVQSRLENETDKSRCLELRLMPMTVEKRREIWTRQKVGEELIGSPEFTGHLLGRIMIEWPHIRENIRRLKEHLGHAFDARRAELMAHLMSGCYALQHGGVMDEVAMDHSVKVAQAYAETEEKTSEVEQCLGVLLDSFIYKNEMTTRQCCTCIQSSPDLDKKDAAKQALEAYGMRWREKDGVDYLQIQVSPVHSGIRRIYTNSRWPTGKINSVLGAGCEGVNPNEYGIRRNSINTGAGTPKRGLLIPANLIIPVENEDW